MAVIDTKQIRNIALLGHGGCGKTSLAEAMLYITGGTDRLGKVADGNTVSDYDAEETKRGFSLSASLLNMMWKDTKINLIDAPGYLDFVGEVNQALRVADSAIIVMDASDKDGEISYIVYNEKGEEIYTFDNYQSVSILTSAEDYFIITATKFDTKKFEAIVSYYIVK